MKFKEWLDCEKIITRRELLMDTFYSSFLFGVVGYVSILYSIIFRPHDENGKWKYPYHKINGGK